MLVDQEEYLAAMVRRHARVQALLAIFMCGTPMASDAGAEAVKEPDIDKAKQLFKEAGYKGEKIIMMHADRPADQAPAALVIAQKLRKAGINVDLAGDGLEHGDRAPREEGPAEKGGWNIFITWSVGHDVIHPLTNASCRAPATRRGSAGRATRDRGAARGWACVPTAAERKKIAEDMQARLRAGAVHHFGQFNIPMAYRTNLSGVIVTGGSGDVEHREEVTQLGRGRAAPRAFRRGWPQPSHSQ